MGAGGRILLSTNQLCTFLSSVTFTDLKIHCHFSRGWVKFGMLVFFLVGAEWIVFAAGWEQGKESFRRDVHLCHASLHKTCSSSSDLASLGVWDLRCRRCKWGFRSYSRATFEFLVCLKGKTMHMQ